MSCRITADMTAHANAAAVLPWPRPYRGFSLVLDYDVSEVPSDVFKQYLACSRVRAWSPTLTCFIPRRWAQTDVMLGVILS
jgi:hypothetical protein